MNPSSAHPELTVALSKMLDKIDGWLKEGGYLGDPIDMYLAGGMAVHFHCGVRYTEDVDATFSKRLLVPANDLMVDYQREDGLKSTLYFDANYNDAFALMHPDYRENALEWTGIGNKMRLVRLRVLTPVDLAVSKISRYSEQDRNDILALAARDYFTSQELHKHAGEALDYYVGNLDSIRLTIDMLCKEIAKSD